MFIIFGTPRSGTTLLATTLDQHSLIAVPDETDFIIPLAFIFDRVRDPVAGRRLISELIVQTDRFPVSLGRFVQPDEIAAAVAAADYQLPALLESVYACVSQATGRPLVGDKSPNDLAYARILLKHGLAASPIKVIHMVRDIRDVLLSLAEAQPHGAAEFSRYFARFWAQSNLFLQDMYAAAPEKYHFVRYEDLVQDPAAAFRRITAFLGVPFQDTMLTPAARGRRHAGEIHHRHLNQPIQQRRGNWRQKMPAELQANCLLQAREAFARFGYPTT